MFKSFMSRGVMGAVFAATIAMTNPASAVPVDVELQLLVDVSGSVDATEYNLQMGGIGAAFQSVAVQNAIAAGNVGSIAIQVIQWASSASVSLDWVEVTSANAGAIGTQIAGLSRANVGNLTGPGNAINFGAPLFTDNGFEGDRLVMDVSGDGAQNTGSSTSAARDAALAGSGSQDAVDVINGLPILTDDPNLDVWYTDNVIGGTDAFVLASATFDDFRDAIERKLISEITGEPPQVSEPAVIAMIGMGIVGVAVFRRRTA